MIIVQAIVNLLIIIMGSVLVLFTLLLLALHVMNAFKSKRIHEMREQLICLLSGEAAASRLKSKLYDLIHQREGCVNSISQIRGIRSMRGLLVISETADELDVEHLAVLRREISGAWFSNFLKQQFDRGHVDSVILVVKLVGVLGLNQYTSEVVQQIYYNRTNPHMQNIGLLSLCLLGTETPLVSICRDSSIASLLSFRTLEELFKVYRGDKEQLCRKLIDTAADIYIRRTCVKAIGENHYDSLAQEVLPLLDHSQLNMRIDAVRTLGQLAYAPAYQPILALAKNDRWELRAVVATALSAFDPDKNAETLIDLLCDREWWVRYRAAESLLCCSDPDDIVRRVAAREDRFAREMMQFALDKQYLRTRKGAA